MISWLVTGLSFRRVLLELSTCPADDQSQKEQERSDRTGKRGGHDGEEPGECAEEANSGKEVDPNSNEGKWKSGRGEVEKDNGRGREGWPDG